MTYDFEKERHSTSARGVPPCASPEVAGGAATPPAVSDNTEEPAAKQILTVSSAKTYQACQHMYNLRYELGLIPRSDDAGARRFGALWHHGLEALFKNWDLNQALEIIEELDGDVDPFDAVKLGVLLGGYFARWGDSSLEVMGVEQEFLIPLVNPDTGSASRLWSQAGKKDAIVRKPDGSMWVMEHKTTSEDITIGSAYWQRLQMDTQCSVYLAAEKAAGHDVAGIIYDVVRKPTIRPCRATPEDVRKYKKDGTLYASQREHDETPDEYRSRLVEDVAANPGDYFARGEVVRLESEQQEAAWDSWQVAKSIRESQLRDRWPRNPDSCVRYGRFCDYWPLCTHAATIDDYARERAHSELTEVTT
jgi:hypothetical protein